MGWQDEELLERLLVQEREITKELEEENERLKDGLRMLEYDCYGVAYVYPDRRLVNALLTDTQESE